MTLHEKTRRSRERLLHLIRVNKLISTTALYTIVPEISRRTIRNHLSCLKQEGIIESRSSITDARTLLWRIRT